jgi:hypothetical protein
LVQTDETHTVDFDLEPLETGSIQGTVTAGGEPVEGVAVSVQDQTTESEQAVAVTDADGTYDIELGVGSYQVVADELLYEAFSETVNVTVGESTGLDIQTRTAGNRHSRGDDYRRR